MSVIRVLADGRSGVGRRAVLAGLAGGVALGLAGCRDGSATATATATTAGRAPAAPLQLLSWEDYDAPENLTSFDGAPWVQVEAYASNEEMVTKLLDPGRRGTYDVIVPTDTFVADLAGAGLLLPLDRSKLKNFANLDPAYLGRDFDPENRFSVPKNSGTTGFVYDTTVIRRELTSWADFLDAAQHEASGRTSLLDDPVEIGGAVLAARGVDPNSTDMRELAALRPYLVDVLGPHVAAFETNVGTGAIAQSRYALSQCYNGDARLGLLESPDPGKWRFVYPTPTANVWMDNWCILAEAAQPDVAHAFIDHMLGREASAAEVQYHGYDTCLRGVRADVERAGLEHADLVFPTHEVLARMTPLKNAGGASVVAEAVNALRESLGR